jgi:hypothetical protein
MQDRFNSFKLPFCLIYYILCLIMIFFGIFTIHFLHIFLSFYETLNVVNFQVNFLNWQSNKATKLCNSMQLIRKQHSSKLQLIIGPLMYDMPWLKLKTRLCSYSQMSTWKCYKILRMFFFNVLRMFNSSTLTVSFLNIAAAYPTHEFISSSIELLVVNMEILVINNWWMTTTYEFGLVEESPSLHTE